MRRRLVLGLSSGCCCTADGPVLGSAIVPPKPARRTASGCWTLRIYVDSRPCRRREARHHNITARAEPHSAPDCRDVAAVASAWDRARAASSAARPSLRTALMNTSMSTAVAVGFACSQSERCQHTARTPSMTITGCCAAGEQPGWHDVRLSRSQTLRPMCAWVHHTLRTTRTQCSLQEHDAPAGRVTRTGAAA